ncbi:hypothetical protein NLG97_g1830 [Lecanicillium saksenae]|uniref:Uncharacterized protein n=1 Tax=Lecanicillium saksenae TaxID=468837 RepID=A0ACC1R2P5_9HYPO|nr:hypothetical protein NLG97_g1830 [Lecanicillium saksenae]
MSAARPVVFLGAAGEMCRIAVERYAKASTCPIVLTDINQAAVEELAKLIPAERCKAFKLDIFNKEELAAAIDGAALVVLGAGPYAKTSAPVIEACIEAKVSYLDFDDDVVSTVSALDLSKRAEEAGIACYVGCGASPGMSNVMAMDAARELDSVTQIDLCWLVGQSEGGVGRAVLEHLVHIAAGPCLTWEDGKPALHESYVETAYAPMLGDNEVLMHETAHPEPVTLQRQFPGADRIRCLGGLVPAPSWGVARGLARAVRRGALSLAEVVDFLHSAANLETPPAVWVQTLAQFKHRVPGVDIPTRSCRPWSRRPTAPGRAAAWDGARMASPLFGRGFSSRLVSVAYSTPLPFRSRAWGRNSFVLFDA